MLGFFVVIVTFISQPFIAYTQSCKPEDVINRTCQFFKNNADKKEFKTSDGRILENPLASRSVDMSSNTQILSGGYGMGGSTEAMTEFADKEIMFQIELEKIFEKSVIRSWPKRSKKYFTNSMQIGSFLAQVFPNEEKYKVYGSGLNMPHPVGDPKGKVKTYDPQEIKELVDQIGKKNLENIKKIYDQANFQFSIFIYE